MCVCVYEWGGVDWKGEGGGALGTRPRCLGDVSHESGQLCDGLLWRGGLVNTKVGRGAGWRHKWVVYIVTRPRGGQRADDPETSPPLPPQRSRSPAPLYCSFPWQRSAQPVVRLVLNALMEMEKSKKKQPWPRFPRLLR